MPAGCDAYDVAMPAPDVGSKRSTGDDVLRQVTKKTLNLPRAEGAQGETLASLLGEDSSWYTCHIKYPAKVVFAPTAETEFQFDHHGTEALFEAKEERKRKKKQREQKKQRRAERHEEREKKRKDGYEVDSDVEERELREAEKIDMIKQEEAMRG